MYGTLGYLAGRAALTATASAAALPVWVPMAGVAAFGALDELHQEFVPRRSMDAADWLADVLGGAAGVTIAALRRRRRPTSRGANNTSSTRTE